VDLVEEWEKQFHIFMDANYPELLNTIVETTVVNKKKLPQETFDQIEAATKAYKQTAPR
jgi:hypothetical protein